MAGEGIWCPELVSQLYLNNIKADLNYFLVTSSANDDTLIFHF